MYDKTVAELEDKLNASKYLLHFFKAYLLSQPNKKIKVSDTCVQFVTGEEHIEVTRSDDQKSTYIKLSPEL